MGSVKPAVRRAGRRAYNRLGVCRLVVRLFAVGLAVRMIVDLYMGVSVLVLSPSSYFCFALAAEGAELLLDISRGAGTYHGAPCLLVGRVHVHVLVGNTEGAID